MIFFIFFPSFIVICSLTFTTL